MEYREFRLIVTNHTSLTVRRISFNAGAGNNHIALPDITDARISMDRLREQTIQMFRRWLEQNKADQRDEFIVLGSYLYEALFGDPRVKQAFETELDNALKRKAIPPLRLVLEFQAGARDLAEWPWEFLYCPAKKGYFLGACTELILARHTPDPMILDQAMRDDLKPTLEQLRILLVISSPTFEEVQDPYNPMATARKQLPEIKAEDIKNTIGALKHASVVTLKKPTYKDLTNKITEIRPHVLHFIGHGRSGELALVQEVHKDQADWIEDASFADCFAGHRPHLVFLHACEGAVTGSYELFKGLALKLMEAGIPTVVAMQFEVKVGETSRFATRFYDALSLGYSIDKAVQLGRTELGTGRSEHGQQNYSNRAFGCPIIYVLNCTEEIILVQAQVQEQQPPPPVQPQISSTDGYRCPRCREALPGDANFCSNPVCIAGRLTRCSSCGVMVEVDRRCNQCGVVDNSSKDEKPATASIRASYGLRPSAAATT